MSMPTNLTQKQIIIIGGAVLAVIVAATLIFLGLRPKGTGTAALTLTIWGTDSPTAFSKMLEAYSGPGSGTNSEIKYTQIDSTNYAKTLLSAFAAGTGPDIFEIGNRDLPQWQQVATPVPATLATTFSLVTLQNDFPTVVQQDFVSGGQVYALPLSIDTLAMIYNKDLFDTAGVATVPKTWEDLQADIPQLRSVNGQGQIARSAVALGGSEASVANAPDIIFLLMMQNGAKMNGGDGTTAVFATDQTGSNAGINAFNYYLSFSNSGSQNYTWNEALGDSLDSFIQGHTAVIFDYSSALASIKAKAPFLNYGVSTMPQPANATIAVNYAKYNGLAVSRNSPQYAAAWQFLISLTTSPASEKIYTDAAGTPPALRANIQTALTDPNMAVFAAQALTARSWYESNSESVDTIMDTAISNTLNGVADPTKALQQSQDSINSLSQ
jgi:multiple sugar transport system substrate-binding protein